MGSLGGFALGLGDNLFPFLNNLAGIIGGLDGLVPTLLGSVGDLVR